MYHEMLSARPTQVMLTVRDDPEKWYTTVVGYIVELYCLTPAGHPDGQGRPGEVVHQLRELAAVAVPHLVV